MPEVRFNEGYGQQPGQINRFQPQAPQPGMVRLVIKYGLARTPQAANKILLGITVVCFSLAIILFIRLVF